MGGPRTPLVPFLVAFMMAPPNFIGQLQLWLWNLSLEGLGLIPEQLYMDSGNLKFLTLGSGTNKLPFFDAGIFPDLDQDLLFEPQHTNIQT